MKVSPLAGKPIEPSRLVDIPRLITAYFTGKPDTRIQSQRVTFGTSGHRGSAFDNAFNEAHILAITQAICLYRKQNRIDGPVFVGIDTHALSVPAFASALEVFAANNVETMIDRDGGYTPTPAISHAILTYNRGRKTGLADGIVITPSHNPPPDGGFKYNPPNGGPADTDVTRWIEQIANDFLAANLAGVNRIPYERAIKAATVHKHDFIGAYVADLANVVDMEAIARAGVKIGIDPLGGAAVNFWPAVIERYKLDATVVSDRVDPTFGFMTADWDGKIRMDCSSPYAMQRLLGMRERFDVAFANDTDADRHGIVTRTAGLMNPNHYLSVAISYLFGSRTRWRKDAAVGKTMVSSSMIDRVAAGAGRKLIETPVGFKWFVDGLADGSIGFGGEESAGASFLRIDGSVWTTDKDGLIMGLLAGEITARSGRDPGELYADLTEEFGAPVYERIDAPATAAQKSILGKLSPEQLDASELAGDAITSVMTKAPAGGSPFGGIKVSSAHGWFAARPSGTEEVYKIYAESFRGIEHLRRIQAAAQEMIARVFRQAESDAPK
ncbi:MAG: phosphoglucomutase (alpha-D-glucose-1,6-bisphosphate-dependent) [Candidatus Binatus sp.]|uniref:phosphoglucomutase (alpha-D-glucose-1,6-bisphosphate-dependent) n=1 Tax=Candidatus Binatus sp. TaxID=2811406 RepID=UPI00271F50C1|nr:phosphoglucomutase (alpha-D-glucose-1,6-bisphosphate-dependent) [Candidatus Binatus sp.]MDO8433876.1 phosphoglucomutase (alpha-D-glucose-1,6-bisphosphate-dependent) [Candidatus Binatus sp.]